MKSNIFAHIIIDNNSTNTDRVYTYKVPNDMINQIEVGKKVLVPFGFGNKLIEGIIIFIADKIDVEIKKIKYIEKVLSEKPLLDKNMVSLGLWMKEKYLSTYIDVFRTIVPTGIFNKTKRYIEMTRDLDEVEIKKITSQNQRNIIDFLQLNGQVEINKLKTALNMPNIYSSIQSLNKKGIVNSIDKIDVGVNKKYEKHVLLMVDDLNSVISSLSRNAYKQRDILEILKENNSMSLKMLMQMSDASFSSIKALQKKGIISITDKEIKRDPINSNIKPFEKHVLNKEQRQCYETIINEMDFKKGKKFLVHGVTGSGKTEIYLQVIEEVLKKKKQAIVLVPEISLTPQTVDRFVGRFGNKVAILHSRLSLGERYDQWRRINEGDADIVVGARSAIFAPFNDLGLIVIDEEHENSYKSGMNPKYDAIEVAEKRCDLEGAGLILASATPSLETYYRAKAGNIKLLTLNKRANNLNMPSVEIVNMKDELMLGNKSILSYSLYKGIQDNLKKGQQTILFLNRRGHSTFVSCRECGYVAKCKNCDISLTYHSYNDLLKCHYCGMTMKLPKICPSCGSKYIKSFGVGTQKIEEFIKKEFPKSRVARMDVDTTTSKGSHERILNKVKTGQIDILIGTQMIAKGLDFPNVTLVGIIAADLTLNLPDYKSSERTFQLITQVSGRAGRGDVKGRVILQTYQPEHFSIIYAQNNDYISFYNEEIKIRELFKYPPYGELVNILFYGPNIKRVQEVSKIICNELKNRFKEEGIIVEDIFGPRSAPLAKIKNNYRLQIIIKIDSIYIEGIKNILYDICIKQRFKGLKISLDINPNSIM